jgi:2-polyprenyl-3-methyl-5-hydroxy-6-metoxy-1,4-benzoquinol methylase
MREFLKAAMVLHKSCRDVPAGVRFHLLIRFLTCPFHRVLRYVPEGGRLLEVGGGHGLFATLASADGNRTAFVVEPDVRKLLGTRIQNEVHFVAGFDECIRGSFEVVVLLDVLYAIPIEEWDALLARLADRVRPGGTLLVKEMDPRSWKQRWNRMQESLSMRFLKITYAVTFNYERPDAFAARLRSHGFDSVEIVSVDSGYPHPHLLFVARKSPAS